MSGPINSLRSDQCFDTECYFMGAMVEFEAPGMSEWAAAQFAAIHYLHSFSSPEILSIKKPLEVRVRYKTQEMVAAGKKNSLRYQQRTLFVHVVPPDGRLSGPTWSVRVSTTPES